MKRKIYTSVEISQENIQDNSQLPEQPINKPFYRNRNLYESQQHQIQPKQQK